MKDFKTKNGFFTGNVGIGTTNPDSALHVVSSGSASDGITLQQANQSTKVNLRTNASGQLIFEVDDGTVEAMRIDSSGNVGIGTTNPGVKLDIHGVSYFRTPTGGAIISSWATGATTGVSQPALLLRTNETNDRDRIKLNSDGESYFNSGNVGIGTTNPERKLEISADNNGDTKSNYIRITDTDTTATLGAHNGGIEFYSKDSSGQPGLSAAIESIYAGSGGGGEISLSTSANSGADLVEAMRIDNSGNVGIGTTSPADGLLHLKQSGNDAIRLQRTDAGVNNGDIYFGHSGGGLSISTSGAVGVTSADLHIDSAGNVGIGTTSPSGKLDIHTTGASAWGLKVRTDNGDADSIKLVGGGGDSDVKFVVKGTGNVGIGTTNPDSKLHVSGDYIQVDNGYGLTTVGGLKYIADSDNNAPSSGALHSFFTDNGATTALTILKSGNVGIGTTNPAQKLDVYGNIAVNGSTVHTSDDRVKHNEQPIIGALETISKITPKKYIKTVEMYEANHDFELDADGNPIDENGEPVEHRIEAGVIAQQVLTVDELAFAVSPEGVDEDGTVTSPHGLDYNSLFTYAIAAIQEQQTIIEDLKSQNESLIARIEALEG